MVYESETGSLISVNRKTFEYNVQYMDQYTRTYMPSRSFTRDKTYSIINASKVQITLKKALRLRIVYTVSFYLLIYFAKIC